MCRRGEVETRRLSEEHGPSAYRDGFVMFEGLEIHVDPRVLVPREESGLLVQAALGLPDGARVHEVGTGSGAIALAIKAKRPDLRVTASDISPDAVAMAEENAEHLGIPILMTTCAGIPEGLRDSWCDLLIANLPYLTADSIKERPAEVGAEPRIATTGDSGEDGLGEIRNLIKETPSKWMVALEHDTHMGEAVREMLVGAETVKDQNDQERMTTGLIP